MTDPEPFSEQQPKPAAANAETDAGVAGSVTDQWVQVYPPGEAPSEAEPAPGAPESGAGDAPGNGAGALATVLFGVSVIMIVVGSFMPFFQASMALETVSSADSTVSMDAWHLTLGGSLPGTPLAAHVEPAPVPLGYPLLVATLLLAIVVLLRLRALRRPESQRPANALGIAGAAFMAGLVFAVGTFEVAWRGLSTSAAIGPVQAETGSGYWLLVVSAMVSVGAAIAAYRVPAQPLPDPVGMVIVEQEQPPLVPPGQPAEWPVVAVIPNDERTNW